MQTGIDLGSTALALSHDILINSDGTRSMAECQWRTDPPLGLFTQYYLSGLAAVLRLGVERLLIVGGEEQRYKGSVPRVVRPAVMKSLLVRDYHANPALIEVLESDPDTIGNARATRSWLKSNGVGFSMAVTTTWHVERATKIFEGEGVPLLFAAAEDAWVDSTLNHAEAQRRRHCIETMMRNRKYQLRIRSERRGIKDYTGGRYERRIL